jgi:hypothetical protein
MEPTLPNRKRKTTKVSSSKTSTSSRRTSDARHQMSALRSKRSTHIVFFPVSGSRRMLLSQTDEVFPAVIVMLGMRTNPLLWRAKDPHHNQLLDTGRAGYQQCY